MEWLFKPRAIEFRTELNPKWPNLDAVHMSILIKIKTMQNKSSIANWLLRWKHAFMALQFWRMHGRSFPFGGHIRQEIICQSTQIMKHLTSLQTCIPSGHVPWETWFAVNLTKSRIWRKHNSAYDATFVIHVIEIWWRCEIPAKEQKI